MEYREKCKIDKETLERWNFLLSKDLDSMTEEEKEKYKAKPFDSEGGFVIVFEDGSNATIDIASGSGNYYDEIQWHSLDLLTDYSFDCYYEIGKTPIELTVGDNTYIIEWEVAD